MKHQTLVISLLIMLSGGFFGEIYAETVHVTGDYTTAGVVSGDLVVTGGSIKIPMGGLTVEGDVKVIGGYILIGNLAASGGSLKVAGDLIVTNTAPVPDQSNTDPGDAYVRVAGDLEVTGAVLTKSTNAQAYIYAYDPLGTGTLGSIKVRRMTTHGYRDSYVRAAHHVVSTGAIVTRAHAGNAHVISDGAATIYGDIYAGSILTYGREQDVAGVGVVGGDAYVKADNGHIVVNGAIVTEADNGGYISAEGDLRAGAVTTYSNYDHAYVLAERVHVRGDIRTYAFEGQAHVKSIRTTAVDPVWGDIIAQNIYTQGYETAYVESQHDINVRCDIVTCGVESAGSISAYVEAGHPWIGAPAPTFFQEGLLRAQNVMTYNEADTDGDAYVRSKDGIFVTGDIITNSISGHAYVYTGSHQLHAGNISTEGPNFKDVQVEIIGHVSNGDDDIDVTHTICTKHIEVDAGSGRADVITLLGNISAEKIFTDGFGIASVLSGQTIDVKGPVTVKSTSNKAELSAGDDLKAGAIRTDGYEDAFVRSISESIAVVEDIATLSSEADAYVRSSTGDITARSIHTQTDNDPSDDSIEAASGTGIFQFVPDLNTSEIIIENAEFDIDSDHRWNSRLVLQGTCTFNGRGHKLTFGENGRIVVAAGANVTLVNLKINNIGGEAVYCADNDGQLWLHDVTWSQTSDYNFKRGAINIVGDFHVYGYGTSFVYESTKQSTIKNSARFLLDHEVTLSYDTALSNRLAMEDVSSRLALNSGVLWAEKSIDLTRGTLRIDNTVTFSSLPGATITLGDGIDAGNNLELDFGQVSNILWTGTAPVYQKV